MYALLALAEHGGLPTWGGIAVVTVPLVIIADWPDSTPYGPAGDRTPG
ncbi:hypothetical protein [Streptomyces sp. NPDC052496]